MLAQSTHPINHPVLIAVSALAVSLAPSQNLPINHPCSVLEHIERPPLYEQDEFEAAHCGVIVQ